MDDFRKEGQLWQVEFQDLTFSSASLTSEAKSKKPRLFRQGSLFSQIQTTNPEEYFRTRTQAEAPETFTYKNPDEEWNVHPGPAESLTPEGKAAAIKKAKRARGQQ